MKVTATKYEDIEVEVSEEQIEVLMLQLIKEDYGVMIELPVDESPTELIEALAVVYKAYSGKPIDLVERWVN